MMLARWFKKKPDLPAPVKANGFFSTSDDFYYDRRLSDAENAARAIKRTFQRTAKDLKTQGPGGQMIALDEAYPSLQEVKIQNNLGGFLPSQQLIWFAAQGFIGYQTCAMISQNWLINKACTVPARDAVRHGFEITINDGKDADPETIDKIKALDKKYKLKQHLVSYVRMGKIFGIRILLFKVDSPDALYYEKPFNIDGVRPGSYQGMVEIDPYWISPELDGQAAANPASQHFYEPTWWFLNGKRYHRSHLCIMKNYGDLPDILKPTYFYGGIPLPQMIAERVYAAERTANEAPLLAMSKRMTVFSTDISQVMANQEAFGQKMDFWSMLQNNFGVKIIGEAEKIEQFDTALTELDATIMTQFQLVAAIAEVPATKLMGTSPKGFGASGEYEESSYHEMLESIQEHDLSPVVDRHHQLVIKSDLPQAGITRIEHVWKPTDTPTAKEQAEINKAKADTDNAWVQAGAIDGTDVRQRIISDPDSGYNGFEEVVPGGPGDREAQQAQEEALEAPVQGSNKQKAQDMAEGHFDPATGMWNGARLITHQRFLDDEKVDEKIKAGDYVVNVTPEWEDEGKKYRMIIDGHHSLAAAMKARVMPEFIERIPRSEVFNAATRQTTDGKE